MLNLETKSPYPSVVPPPPADIFLTVEKGKTASGVIRITLAEVKKQLLANYPAQFGDKPPAALYVQLFHHPLERGEHDGLDAWIAGTSTTSGLGLYSAPIKVELSKW